MEVTCDYTIVTRPCPEDVLNAGLSKSVGPEFLPERLEPMKKQCGRCHAEEFRRLNRVGVLERKVLPLLGYFPWECALCRRKTYLHADGHRVLALNSDRRRAQIAYTPPDRRRPQSSSVAASDGNKPSKAPDGGPVSRAAAPLPAPTSLKVRLMARVRTFSF
jgi:hypothetical protein